MNIYENELDILCLECCMDIKTSGYAMVTMESGESILDTIKKMVKLTIEKIKKIIVDVTDNIKSMINDLFKKQNKTALEKLIKNPNAVDLIKVEVYDFNDAQKIWEAFSAEILKISTDKSIGISGRSIYNDKYRTNVEKCFNKYYDMLKKDVLDKKKVIYGKEALSYIETQWDKDMAKINADMSVFSDIEHTYTKIILELDRVKEGSGKEKKLSTAGKSLSFTLSKCAQFIMKLTNIVSSTSRSITTALLAANVDKDVIRNIVGK